MNDIQTLRVMFFIAILLLMTGLETAWPRRTQHQNKSARFVINISLAALGSLAVKLMAPLTAIGAAAYASQHGWGLMPALSWPVWLEMALGVFILDAAIYGQHVAFHHIPSLWRLHQVHHTDNELDASSGIRFHPLEIMISMVYKSLIVMALGLSPETVILFEIILSTMAIFNHSNIHLPLWLDNWLRYLLVTPDMHRVHHSVLVPETNSNYGFNLAVWDKAFGTYTAQPRDGHHGMTLGLSLWQTPKPLGLKRLLTLPFQRKKT